MSWLKGKKALLLDMNSTFMFGEDRFGEHEDFSKHYKKIGGKLSKTRINAIILAVYRYLSEKYIDEKYRHHFPSVANALAQVTGEALTEEERDKIVDTFAFHELGHIPEQYAKSLFKLRESFILSVVIDIWSPKQLWLESFKAIGLDASFSAFSFSSDHGMVKPSPRPFELVVRQLNLPKNECLVIGDSVRRDLGGASAAGIDCVLLGDVDDAQACASFPSLLAFCDEIK